MLNLEESCIRYLMREMDPSEEIEFEREMLKDENLLIEVESLRKTYQKLGKLPLKEAPEHIVNKVINDAVKHQETRVHRTRIWVMNFSKAVASVAAALLFISTGIYFYGQPWGEAPQNQAAEIQPLEASAVTPWVDRNDIIELAGASDQSVMSESLQNDVTQSFGRLKLVNAETGISAPSRKIVLTSVSQ